MKKMLIPFLILFLISFVSATNLNVVIYSAGSTITGANVTIRDLNYSYIKSNLTNYNGVASFNLPSNSYIINLTKPGYILNSTVIDLQNDTNISLTIGTWDSLEISSKETLDNIYSRLNMPERFTNLSDSVNPCKYISKVNLIITKNGNLIIDGCTLIINGTDVTRQILDGGALSINNSNITGIHAGYWFYTSSDAVLIIKNSYVNFAGDSSFTTDRRGLEINTPYLLFVNNTFLNNYGIVLNSDNLKLYKLSIRTNRDYNIQNYGKNNYIIDSNLSGAYVSDITMNANTNITLINTNYTKDVGKANSRLYKQWYVILNLKENGTNNNIPGADVIFVDRDGKGYYRLTNNNGIVSDNFTEYVSNGSARFNKNNYSVRIYKTDYKNLNLSLNISNNINLVVNLEKGDCVNEYSHFRCDNVDTNGDYTVNELDTLQDYNLDDTINETDEDIFYTHFYNCSYDPNLIGQYIDVVYVARDTDLERIYQNYINMKDFYGVSIGRYLDSNGTCHEGRGSYNWSFSQIMHKKGNCSYNITADIWVNRNGTLNINNCELYFAGDVSGQYGIKVNDTGFLNITNSKIESEDKTCSYELNAYPTSKIYIYNSYLSEVGDCIEGIPYYYGMGIGTSNATIMNSEINHSCAGIYVYGAYPIIKNLRINAMETGISLENVNNISIDNVTIKGVWYEYPYYGLIMKYASAKYISGYFEGIIEDIEHFWYSYSFERYWKINIKLNNVVRYNSYSYKVFDSSSNLITNGTFDSYGYSPYMNLLEYKQNTTMNKTYYNNYTLSLYRFGLLTDSQNVSITKDETFYFGGNVTIDPESIRRTLKSAQLSNVPLIL